MLQDVPKLLYVNKNDHEAKLELSQNFSGDYFKNCFNKHDQ